MVSECDSDQVKEEVEQAISDEINRRRLLTQQNQLTYKEEKRVEVKVRFQFEKHQVSQRILLGL